MVLTIIKIIILFPVTLLLSVWALLTVPFDKGGRYFRFSPWFWSKCILWIFGIKVTVKGEENAEYGKPYVFVSNHASMFDIPTIVIALKGNVNIVFKKELTRIPIWGWALRYGHFIMIDRSNARDAMASIERAARSIQKGSSVILFPEGTRTSDGKLQPFKRGAFSLAVKSGVPVIPLTINGTYKILPKGSINVRPANISVTVGRPIPTESLNGKNGELYLMDEVHKAIEMNYIDQ